MNYKTIFFTLICNLSFVLHMLPSTAQDAYLDRQLIERYKEQQSMWGRTRSYFSKLDYNEWTLKELKQAAQEYPDDTTIAKALEKRLHLLAQEKKRLHDLDKGPSVWERAIDRQFGGQLDPQMMPYIAAGSIVETGANIMDALVKDKEPKKELVFKTIRQKPKPKNTAQTVLIDQTTAAAKKPTIIIAPKIRTAKQQQQQQDLQKPTEPIDEVIADSTRLETISKHALKTALLEQLHDAVDVTKLPTKKQLEALEQKVINDIQAWYTDAGTAQALQEKITTLVKNIKSQVSQAGAARSTNGAIDSKYTQSINQLLAIKHA